MTGIQLDCKKIIGPNGKWWIDEDGNMHLKGNLVVKEGLDPTFFTCDSQGSVPSVSNIVVVHSDELKFRDSSTAQRIQLNEAATTPVDATSDHNGTSTNMTFSGNQEVDIVTNVSITISSGSRILIVGGFIFGGQSSENIGCKIQRTGDAAVEVIDVNTVGTVSDTIGGGGFAYIDSPGAGTHTYKLICRKENTNIYEVFGGSLALMEIQ